MNSAELLKLGSLVTRRACWKLSSSEKGRKTFRNVSSVPADGNLLDFVQACIFSMHLNTYVRAFCKAVCVAS